MKRISFRIFITVLIAGIVGILGEIILKYNIDRLSDNYRMIVNEVVVNRQYATQIDLLIYQHQTLVSKHVINEEEALYDAYEAEAEEIRAQLLAQLDEFGARMAGDEREQIYHKVYSNVNSYLQNADAAMKLSREGSKGTAAYYCNNIMNELLKKVNGNILEMNEFAVAEMDDAYARMEQYIFRSRISELVCIIAIVAATVICLVYCVRITLNLDRYKEELEEEVAAKNKALQEHNEKTIAIQNNTIIGMANLIENRDGDTGGHVKRTSGYVSLIAQAARAEGYCTEILTDEYIDLLIKAAPLHDIGKIAVPDSILKKPGRLTPEEFACIKDHAAEGGRIVREVLENIEEKEYVDIAVQVASGHHEKWDGSGYPKGLRGTDIPLCARIMAIADVFDALVSKRCYKEAMTPEEAFGVIRDSMGTHFDPLLAKVFLDHKREVCGVLMGE